MYFFWNNALHNIIIHRNCIYYINFLSKAAQNIQICNNILELGISGLINSKNVIISNNILCGRNGYGASTIQNANITTIITNNLNIPIALGSYYFGKPALFSCDSATITNNIFYYRTTAGCTNCTFTNNLGFGISSIVSGNNMGGNNIIADPQFPATGFNQNNYFDYSDNYNLPATSPGKNAGSDSTDIGIFGGAYPWPIGYGYSYRNAAMPKMPVMQSINVNNTNIPQNSTLNITIKARKGDN